MEQAHHSPNFQSSTPPTKSAPRWNPFSRNTPIRNSLGDFQKKSVPSVPLAAAKSRRFRVATGFNAHIGFIKKGSMARPLRP